MAASSGQTSPFKLRKLKQKIIVIRVAKIFTFYFFFLFHVSLKNVEQFTKLFFTIGLLSTLNTIMQVVINQPFRERLNRFSRGYKLGQDLGTLSLVVNHLRNTVELTNDFSKSYLQGFHLFAAMNVRHRLNVR